MTQQKKNKKEFTFFWEEPIKETKKVKPITIPTLKFKFTIPKFHATDKMTRKIPINITTSEKDVIVQAELPGFKKRELNLNVTESFIEISASKQERKIEKTENMFRQEMSIGALKRAFTLPDKVDPDKATAKLADGLLTIILPKLYPEKKKKRKLEVS